MDAVGDQIVPSSNFYVMQVSQKKYFAKKLLIQFSLHISK